MNLGQRLLITIFVILTLGAITACRESHSSPALPRQDAAVTPDQVAHIGADDQATPTDIPLPDVIRPPADLWRDPVPTAALEAARSIASARYYRQDPIDVVYRFQNPDRLIPEVTRQEPWGFQIGDSHVFWVEDKVSLEQYQVKADLVYESSHAYYFVEEGVEVNGRDLGVLAERFETRIYPTTRSFLGEEWSPGVDGDPHLVFLLVGRLGGGVGGYHDDRDGYSQLVYPSSNEMEMIYLSVNGLTLDSPSTECLLAHEFQHLIRWAVDQDEEIWLNEAFGELACSINDLAPHYRGRTTNAFTRHPDIQLNGWTRDRELVEAQYGASYLFITYFHDRFGDEALRALSDHPANGLQGIDQTLDSLPGDPDFETVFADWVVANLIDDSELNDGRYGYRSYHPRSMSLDAEYRAADIPVEIQGSVNQFGADAISLVGPGVFVVDFAGENLVRLVPTAGSQGEVFWWSGPGTKSDSTLTREFDLTGLSEATLTFSTRYDIERYFNYAYVAISTGDDHWSTLPGLWTIAEDPSGMNLGHGYTGNSDGWKEESIDLTPYTGQVVRLRFEYLALGGPLGSGFFIDQVAIPELGYEHDLEVDDGGWEARGFLRLANLLPQKWLVQLVSQRSAGTEVEHAVIEPGNRGSWRFELDEDEMVTLLISGITRGTTEASGYWIAVR